MASIPVSVDAAWSSLAYTVGQLMQSRRELADLLAAEHEGKVEAWARSEATAINQRDREAAHVITPLTIEIIQLKGEVAAFEEERDFLRQWIDHNSFS